MFYSDDPVAREKGEPMADMKGITCCGDCIYYDWKKKRCKRCASQDDDPKAHFFADCPLPSVEPERPKGRWKYYHKRNIAVCTNCSFERKLDADFGKAVTCPNCGADMRGENNG